MVYARDAVVYLCFINTENKYIMKTLAIILTTALTLIMNLSMAIGKESKSNGCRDCAGTTYNSLAPSAPAQATFDEAGTLYAASEELGILRPEVPEVADFSDGTIESAWNDSLLAPRVPMEAGFSDGPMEGQADLADFVTLIPTLADFE
jgi:hypothetical protein